MTVPRRGRPSPGSRLAAAVRSQSVNTADGSIISRHAERPTPTAPIPTSQDVTIGEAVDNAISITSTGSGDGSSRSLGFGTIAIGSDAYAIGGPDPTNLGAMAVGSDARAEADEGVAVGPSSRATADGSSWGPTAVGPGAEAHGDGAVAIGRQAAVGSSSADVGGGAVAIGAGVTATDDNDFILGNGNHNVQVPGKFILTDESTGNRYRLDLTGGALTLVAYP